MTEEHASRAIANRAPKRSIARKFTLLVTIAVMTSAVAMSGVMLWQETNRYAATKSRTLLVSAQVFATAAAHGVAAKDQGAVYQALKAIGRVPGFLYVRIEARDGQLLAAMGGATQLDGDLRIKESEAANISPFAVLSSHSIQVEAPIVSGGVDVGRFILVADTQDLADGWMDALKGAAAGAVVALGVGLLVAGRLQKSLTRPVLEFSEAIWRIRRHHNYAERVEARSDDEVGLLIEGFNDLLGELDLRDKSLVAHRLGLEKEVADRTRDLERAKEAAESANAAKSDFLAAVSHEIRTPMNGVLVMAELLAAADLPARQRRYAEVIVKSGQSLLAIINDILDFSKMESGRLKLQQIGLDPSEIAEDVTSLFAEQGREKGLDLVSYVSPATPRLITGDPVRINQVISTLVNNALKFTQAGSVILKVGPDPKNPARIRFAVSDTGVGIRAHKLEQIAGVFAEAEQTTAHRFGGTGLGLTISQRLVAAMGGEMDAKSVFGRGSTFAFSIPTGARELAEAWPAPRRTGATALVAVQGEATRATLLRYLTEAGYHASAAPDGAPFAADVVIAEPERIDFVVRAETPYLVCLSAFADAAAHRLVREGRADVSVARPLRRSEIVLLLRRIKVGQKLGGVLDKRSSRGETPPRCDGRHILVAEDKAIHREVAIETLQQLGAVAVTAETGAQAIALLENETFDAVLMDVGLREMDGFETARRIRRREEETGRSRTPIIALTSHVIGPQSEAWKEAGMDAALYKPITMSALATTLASLLPEAPGGADETPVGALAINEAKLREQGLLGDTGATAFLRRLATLYLDLAPRALLEIREAAGAQNHEALGKAAHSLHSMSVSVCAEDVDARARRLERGAAVAAPATGEELDALAAAVTRSCAALRELMREEEREALLQSA